MPELEPEVQGYAPAYDRFQQSDQRENHACQRHEPATWIGKDHDSLPHRMGTWAAATWAIRFNERHGFRQVTAAEKDRLLRTYWSIPERQVETSVVLANAASPVATPRGNAQM